MSFLDPSLAFLDFSLNGTMGAPACLGIGGSGGGPAIGNANLGSGASILDQFLQNDLTSKEAPYSQPKIPRSLADSASSFKPSIQQTEGEATTVMIALRVFNPVNLSNASTAKHPQELLKRLQELLPKKTEGLKYQEHVKRSAIFLKSQLKEIDSLFWMKEKVKGERLFQIKVYSTKVNSLYLKYLPEGMPLFGVDREFVETYQSYLSMIQLPEHPDSMRALFELKTFMETSLESLQKELSNSHTAVANLESSSEGKTMAAIPPPPSQTETLPGVALPYASLDPLARSIHTTTVEEQDTEDHHDAFSIELKILFNKLTLNEKVIFFLLPPPTDRELTFFKLINICDSSQIRYIFAELIAHGQANLIRNFLQFLTDVQLRNYLIKYLIFNYSDQPIARQLLDSLESSAKFIYMNFIHLKPLPREKLERLNQIHHLLDLWCQFRTQAHPQILGQLSKEINLCNALWVKVPERRSVPQPGEQVLKDPTYEAIQYALKSSNTPIIAALDMLTYRPKDLLTDQVIFHTMNAIFTFILNSDLILQQDVFHKILATLQKISNPNILHACHVQFFNVIVIKHASILKTVPNDHQNILKQILISRVEFELATLQPLCQKESAAAPRPLSEQAEIPHNSYLLFHSSSQSAIGPVSMNHAKSVRQQLEKLSPAGIAFKESDIKNHLEGGFCTAISLSFLDSFLKMSTPLAPTVGQLENMSFQINPEILRNRQAAFNSITVDASIVKDPSLSKMQALVNFNSLNISWFSKEMDLHLIDGSEFNSILKAAPEGEFVLRIITPADNAKLELHGHTLIYIKRKGLHLMFDSNFGLMRFASHDFTGVFDHIKHVITMFEGLRFAKLYQVQKTAALSN